MKNRCNNCVKFLTCDRAKCEQITYLQARQIERIEAISKEKADCKTVLENKKNKSKKRKGEKQMQKHERAMAITLIILFLLIMFLIGNISYRNNLIKEQQQKITDLEIELDSEKEKSYQFELEKKRSVLNE